MSSWPPPGRLCHSAAAAWHPQQVPVGQLRCIAHAHVGEVEEHAAAAAVTAATAAVAHGDVGHADDIDGVSTLDCCA